MAFAREVHDVRWIFDLFALGFDHLSQYAEPPDEDDASRVALEENDAYARLAGPILRADGDIPHDVLRYLDPPADDHLLTARPFLRRLAAVLHVIDRTCDGLNYLARFQDRRHWRRVSAEMERRNLELNRADRRVIVKPRLRFPEGTDAWWRRGLSDGTLEASVRRGEHWNRRFANLCRVPEIPGCEIVHIALPPMRDLSDADWSTLRIGMVPLVHEIELEGTSARLTPGPLRIVSDDSHHLIVDGRGDWDGLARRAASAIRSLARERAQFVLFPEAIVADPVVHAIKEELYRLTDTGNPYPLLVLAGTFERVPPDGSPPGYNEAIVLNGRGEELWRQSKLHPYEMQYYEQQRYGLDSLFGGRPAREYITTRPRRLVFCDSPSTGIRMMVAICEDSAQDDPGLHAIRAMQPNLVMVPVMAGPLLGDRGFARTVDRLTTSPGCLAAVVNSAALPRAEWRRTRADGTPPLGIVGLPELTYSATYQGFRLLDAVQIVDTEGTEALLFECPDS